MAIVPPKITEPPKDRKVIVGQTVEINCKATAAPDPVIQWLRDDVIITEGNRYSTNNDGVLTIRNVTKADEGRYVCAARNTIGAATAHMFLTVEG